MILPPNSSMTLPWNSGVSFSGPREVSTVSDCLFGGVAANSRLREDLARRGGEKGLRVAMPPRGLCTDNGAMSGAAGWRRFLAGVRAGPDLDAVPSLRMAAGR